MKTDFQVLIRSMDNHYFVPYREMKMEKFGKIPEFKTTTKDIKEVVIIAERVDNTDEEGYMTVGTNKNKNKKQLKALRKSRIEKSITALLNGFDSEEEDDNESLEPSNDSN